MRKRMKLALQCLSLLFVLCGCWNYRGLNEIAIVAGMAIDLDPISGEFRLVYETADLTNVKTGGIKSKLVESTGKTVFDAARNAKKRLEKKLYFGNNQILIISEKIAKSGQLKNLIDWFLRDAELRETIHIFVSQEITAAELLGVKGINDPIVSYEIERMIMDDNKFTSSTNTILLYKVYDTLHTEGVSLTLPVLRKTINANEFTNEINGVAVFKGETMLGYLTPEESKYYLFAIDKVKGGILTLPAEGGEKDNVSLEISQNSTKQSFAVEGGKLKITVDTQTRVYLDEVEEEFNALDEKQVTSLETAAGAKLKQQMESVIKKVQTEYGSDIFGFGNTIRKKNMKLWSSVSGYWDEIFPTLQVTVNAKVTIANSAYIKDTRQEDKQ